MKDEDFKHKYWTSVSQKVIRNWNLEGSNDGNDWTVIKKHTNDTALDGGTFETATWMVEENEYFNQFRIFVTGKTGSNDWQLACSGIELYGNAFGETFIDGMNLFLIYHPYNIKIYKTQILRRIDQQNLHC